MKYRKLPLLISFICLANINAKVNKSRYNVTRQRKSKTYAKTDEVQFCLRYDFSVPGKTSKIKFIVRLPKTIPYRQSIYDITYSPEPSSVFSKNGNDYVEFLFEELQKKFKVEINVSAKLFRYDLSTARGKLQENLPEDPNLNDFLKQEKYIEKDNSLIQQIAKSITGRDQIDTVRNIYNYVINNMEYQGYNEEDLGAIKAVQLKKGDCSEYSDLFVALCRAKNIPARVIEGYTTEFTDTPKHAWPEAYFKNYGWVPFDPTHGDKEDKRVRNKRFRTLERIYIYFNHIRNDEVINEGHYYRYWYWGNKIKVKDSIEFKRPTTARRKVS